MNNIRCYAKHGLCSRAERELAGKPRVFRAKKHATVSPIVIKNITGEYHLTQGVE
jgi:hypothetical protein